ncbi:d-4,5 unsaturated-glucuronyl hydrolase-like protein [Punctularia strigosozonata HHB-11173 SS5]|uniref:d-4,5 unsaturated-glucuronyl hydrolase-like protein n=1 Tax=Punctularia strigosozonata (strain HHB-11173) TaxID=741275 RepID=UPI0004416534|nr:d-4,5 unsaturated-glucuronyl hydrolase-like protein [Punctularia strigosozonata HHB-11173 SS5]EIN08034.1 d-4,5 unsaturated-glucuronyl hydrolase-like protein [Punctularia strigosozonata HHB-11173 SS5]
MLSLALTAPPELFSPLVSQKILAIAQNTSSLASRVYPQYTTRDTGSWLWFVPDTWTTGFFPATLYAMQDRSTLCPKSVANTKGADWVDLGRAWSTAEIPLEINTGVGHDVGFLSFPFVDELAVNPDNQTAVTAVNAFANHLAGRFNPIVGCTRSWDTADPTDFQVIIDNMMNLEVFFNSEALTGNRTYREMAISHANKTMENHVRPDGSTFHVVEYNSTTGAVIRRRTSQGYADNSTWSRGQSWAIYGFANIYANTQIPDYLETARRTASYFVDNLPADGVVPWDFNAPLGPPRPADSSAAMIASSGLLLLAQQELALKPANHSGATHWINAALNIISANTKLAWRPEWESLLLNGTVNNPTNPPNNLTGIVYGDYYFVKTGNTLVEMGLAKCD